MQVRYLLIVNTSLINSLVYLKKKDKRKTTSILVIKVGSKDTRKRRIKHEHKSRINIIVDRKLTSERTFNSNKIVESIL